MCQGHFTQWPTYQAFESTQWRETILVQSLWQGIFNHQLPFIICKHTLGRNHFNAAIMTRRIYQTFTITFYIGRNHINTVKVTRPFHRNFILCVLEKPYFCLEFTFLLEIKVFFTNCISLLMHKIAILFVLNSHCYKIT